MAKQFETLITFAKLTLGEPAIASISSPAVLAVLGPAEARVRLEIHAGKLTTHSFLSATSAMLNEPGKWNANVIEPQLAHVEGNSVCRPNACAEYWEEQERMMNWRQASSVHCD